MSLLGGHAVGPLALGVVGSDLPRSVKFEALRAAVDELLQVLEPRLVAFLVIYLVSVRAVDARSHENVRLGLPAAAYFADDILINPGLGNALGRFHFASGRLGRSDRALFLVAVEIVVDAKPERKLESHALERTDPGHTLGFAPARKGEEPRIPRFARRKIIKLLHPARFQSEHIAGSAGLAELVGVAHQIELVDELVGDERETVSERRQHLRTARKLRVDVQKRLVVLAGKDVEVDLAFGRFADERVLVLLSDVEIVAPGGVHQKPPALRRDDHRHRNVAVDVLNPDLVAFAAALDVLAAHVAESVHALVRRERNAQRIPLADSLGIDLDIGGRRERLQGECAVSGVHRHLGAGGLERVVLAGERRLRPVALQNAVAVHARLGPAVRPAAADTEKILRQNVNAQFPPVRKFPDRAGFAGFYRIFPHGARLCNRGELKHGGQQHYFPDHIFLTFLLPSL